MTKTLEERQQEMGARMAEEKRKPQPETTFPMEERGTPGAVIVPIGEVAQHPARGGIARSQLYDEIWAEPMTVVAARYDVSANYLARVCRHLHVPHPPRGYWAKLS